MRMDALEINQKQLGLEEITWLTEIGALQKVVDEV